jgi:hypothetical protein
MVNEDEDEDEENDVNGREILAPFVQNLLRTLVGLLR